jgi:hypothetical protein
VKHEKTHEIDSTPTNEVEGICSDGEVSKTGHKHHRGIRHKHPSLNESDNKNKEELNLKAIRSFSENAPRFSVKYAIYGITSPLMTPLPCCRLAKVENKY